MKDTPLAIVWFRNDLRLSDNPALSMAAKSKKPLLLIYIANDDNVPWKMGSASSWWARQSITTFQEALLKKYGAKLILRKGNPQTILLELAHTLNAKQIFWNRVFEPYHLQQDRALEAKLAQNGMTAHAFNGSLLKNPWEYRNQSGGYFKVFTPFWKKLLQEPLRELYTTPPTLTLYENSLLSESIEELFPLPQPNWYPKLEPYWNPGEKGAKAQLRHFLTKLIDGYAENRDRPDLEGTSRLSPHLHFGEISPLQIWHAAQQKRADSSLTNKDVEKFLSEMAWREFSYQLLYHFPELPKKPFKSEFEKFSWKTSSKLIALWQKGQTGYPIVDAGMRQLWETGYMHNRVRMICASFLTKHLLQPWQKGEQWFWDTLVDADLANNAASWQWVAGSGADAAPYFRIFNPVLQGEKFDPEGDYVKKWVPELKHLPIKYLHSPWEASTEVLEQAGCVLGKSYPFPVIEHKKGRQDALAAYKELKG